ncbi:MAG: hypothetical protein U0271_26130 [Polyangiaceae bacterium]
MKWAIAALVGLGAASLTTFARAEAPRDPRVELDGLFTYGIGNGHALGGRVNVTGLFPAWRTDRANGSLDLGAYGGYENEPIELQPWMDDSATTGTTHRIPFGATFGFGFHFHDGRAVAAGKATHEREVATLATYVYLGGVHWISQYEVRYPSRGIEGYGEAIDTVLDAGALVRLGVPIYENLALSFQLGAPFFGIGPSTVIGLFTTGVGLSVTLPRAE